MPTTGLSCPQREPQLLPYYCRDLTMRRGTPARPPERLLGKDKTSKKIGAGSALPALSVGTNTVESVSDFKNLGSKIISDILIYIQNVNSLCCAMSTKNENSELL